MIDDKAGSGGRPLTVVVLAAGEGTRMRSALPKVLHKVAGKAMLDYVLDAVAELRPARVALVVGPNAEAVRAGREATCSFFEQRERRGTGHAVLAAREALETAADEGGDVLVVYGDGPLIRAESLADMVAQRAAAGGDAWVLMAFRAADPTGYGRLFLDAEGRIVRIVEERDASDEERRIELCNGGPMLAGAGELLAALDGVKADNAKGEYYLPDCIGLAREAGTATLTVEVPEAEIQGVNSRAELALAEAAMQARLRARLMEAGVTLIDPASVWLSHDTRIGRDSLVEPNVVFGPGVEIGEGVRVGAFSHLADCRLADGTGVGPFARLRGGAELAAGAQIGNFVELKNAKLGEGVKAMHLSYLGDAEIGARSNIGAGTITCNYDGVLKHRTTLGEGCFIGSNTALVAPVTLGDGALIGAGSTITRDVPAEALALTRAPQKVNEGGATKLRERLKAQKKG